MWRLSCIESGFRFFGSYSISHIHDITVPHHDTTLSSKIEFLRTYHQITSATGGVRKTAVTAPSGLCEFLCMPFGLRNAIQTFQSFSDSITRDLDFVHVCIDDLLITLLNVDGHIQHLTLLSQLLSDNQTVVNPDKRELGKTELAFFGHETFREGIKTSEDKVCTILDYVVSPSIKELKAFWGS